jgi:hypothetical protein
MPLVRDEFKVKTPSNKILPKPGDDDFIGPLPQKGKDVGGGTKLYSNRFPEDIPNNVRLERLSKVGDKFKNQKGYTAGGTYQYVIKEDGTVLMGKDVGHIDLAQGGKVQYAGEVTFTNSGKLKNWSNRSGHYWPEAGQASNFIDILKNNGITDINMDNFIPFVPGK